jgi:hypothetical protein
LTGAAGGALTAAEDYRARQWRPVDRAGVEYTFAVRLTNDDERVAMVTVTCAGATNFAVHFPARFELPPRAATALTVRASIAAAKAKRLPPFSLEAVELQFSATGSAARSSVPLQLGTAGALTPPGTSYVQAVRTRLAGAAPGDKLRGLAQRTTNEAEKILVKLGAAVEPPTETGWLEGPEDNPWHIWHWPRYIKLEKMANGTQRCPECGKGWTPEQIVSGRDRFVLYRSALDPLSKAALITGDARYARAALAILQALAKAYRSYPVGPYHTRLGLNFMHECIFDIQATAGLRRLHLAGLLPAEDLAAIAAGFLIPSIETVLPLGGGTPNQAALRASVVAEAGLVLNWPPYVAWALRQPDKGFDALTQSYLGRDGGWREGSLSYHVLAMRWLLPLPAVLKLYGFDLLATGDLGARLRNFVIFPLRAARPDYRLPAINDAGLASLQNEWNDMALYLSRDPRLAPWTLPSLDYVATVPANATTPGWESRDFPDFGVAVLHDRGAPGRENWVMLDYGEHGGGHGHFDKLNICCYAWGQPLNDDLGSAYSSPLQFAWLRNTLSHCTITVDEAGQQAATGRLDFWRAPEHGPQIATASTEGAYPGVRLERTIVLAGGAQVFIDRAVSTNEHLYDWTFTGYGVATNASCAAQPRAPLPGAPLPPEFVSENIYWKAPGARVGYDVPRNLKEGTIAGNWRMDWEGVRAPYSDAKSAAVRVRWLGWCSQPARLIWGDIPGYNLTTNAMRWVMVRQQGREAAWVTALIPHAADTPPAIDGLRVVPPEKGRGIGVQLTSGASNVCWIAANDRPGQQLKVGPLSTKEKAAARE